MKKNPSAATLLMFLLSGYACAEDKLKPYVDLVGGFFSNVGSFIGRFFYGLFPSLERSVNQNMTFLDGLLPAFKEYHWIFYLALAFFVLAILSKVWENARRYVMNSIGGIILLLILIHLFGVEIEVTVWVLLLTALFGIPGVLFVAILHYAGISI